MVKVRLIDQEITMTTTPEPPTGKAVRAVRRYDLDWLRVIAILLLHFYHSGMAFVAEWGWHLKNPETSNIFQEWMYFLSRWRMSLLFLISGAGTWYVLKRASAGEYIWRRVLRLLVPLVVGIFVIVPPQIYFERVADGARFGSYLNFYFTVFEFRPYPEGNTSWHHLWFIAYLFLYSALGVPLFLFLRSEAGRNLVGKFAGMMNGPVLYALGLPIAFVYARLIIEFPGPQNLVSDWAMFSVYFLYFIYGFIFTVNERFANTIEANRQTSLKLGCITYVLLCYFRWNDREPIWGYNPANLAFLGLVAFNSWFWVLTILGYGKRYLNRTNRLLVYANEAIYPFYILHQTVIVMIVFYVVQTSDTILTKFIFVVLASFALTMALYHFAVRPYRVTRFLFGMKPKESGGGD